VAAVVPIAPSTVESAPLRATLDLLRQADTDAKPLSCAVLVTDVCAGTYSAVDLR
jgi:hypothetical protein